MQNLRADTEAIAYFRNAAPYFQRIRQLPFAVWLDSCPDSEQRGRFDLISAAPLDVLQLDQASTDPFTALEQLQSQLQAVDAPQNLPFCGGCIGSLAYEANHSYHGLHLPKSALAPLVNVGLYSWALIQDHQQQESYLVFHPQCDANLRQQVKALLAGPEPDLHAFELLDRFSSGTSHSDYHRAIQDIRDYIRAGDCYQVNYAQHFSAAFDGDLLTAYLQLRSLSPTPFAAYLETDTSTLLSLSPERFIDFESGQVRTFPIKGTTPRYQDPIKDEDSRRRLASSLKDKAENLMIVDLMRNDIAQICEPGSVSVPQLFNLQSYSTVHHLVSEVNGVLAEGRTPADILRYCLPGGSISGAPKRRAMQIIDELEPVRRSLYCGSIFYWSCSGRFDSSITIRTMLAAHGTLHCWGGGGITADSDPDQEWQEILDKVQPLMHKLEREFFENPAPEVAVTR